MKIGFFHRTFDAILHNRHIFVGTLGKAKMSGFFIDNLPLDCACSYSQSLKSAGTKVVSQLNQNRDEAYIATITFKYSMQI